MNNTNYSNPGETVKDFIERSDVKIGDALVTNGKMTWEVSPQVGSSGWYLRCTDSDKAHIGKAAIAHVSIPNLHVQPRYMIKAKIEEYINMVVTPELGKSIVKYWDNFTLSLGGDLSPADKASLLNHFFKVLVKNTKVSIIKKDIVAEEISDEGVCKK